MHAHRTAHAQDEYQLNEEHMGPNAAGQDSPPMKKSVMGKFKDMAKGEAKKLKTKIKKKSPDNENEEDESSNCSSSEDEGCNDQNKPSLGQQAPPTTPDSQQQEDQPFPEKGASNGTTQASPDQEAPGSGTLQQRFSLLKLESGKVADTTPEDGIGKQGSDLLISSHDIGNGFTDGDQDDEKPLKECEGESKSLKDPAYEGLNASKEKFDGATAGDAGALGYDAAGRSTEAETKSKKETEEKKSLSLLEQAKEKIFGSKKSITERSHPATIGQQGEQQDKPTDAAPSAVTPSDEPKPTMTRLATQTMWGIKDKVASTIGYGSSSPRDEGAAADRESVVTDDKASEDEKSDEQKLQEKAAGAKDVVAAKVAGSDSTKTTSAGSRFSPGEEEKALSQLITDAMSSSVASVKGTLMSPFTRSASSSPASTPRTPGGRKATATDPAPAITTDPAPATTDRPTSDEEIEAVEVSPEGVKAIPEAVEESPAAPAPEAVEATPAPAPAKGIVGRVTGAVSSFLGKKPISSGQEEEALCKSVSDNHHGGSTEELEVRENADGSTQQ